MKKPAVVSLLLLLVLLISSFFIQLSAIPIRIWDEARLANNALEMYLNGNWIVTYYDGSPDMYNTKPPLLIWLQVINMHLFGLNEAAVRIPSALASVSTGILIWWFLKKRLEDHWAGFLAGSVFATTFAYVYIHAGRTGDYDALLSLFTTLYCLSIYFFITEKKTGWLYLFWLCISLAGLTKGVAGLLFLPGIALFILFQKATMALLFNKHFYIGALGFVVLVGGYYLLREQYNPGYLKAVWENELGGRYGTVLEGHGHPFNYFFRNMYRWRNEYWFYFIVPALVTGLAIQNKEIRRISLFNVLMVLPYFLIISSAQTKLEWYDIPLYPFLSIQIAILLYFVWHWAKQWINKQQLRTAFAIASFMLIFFFPFQQCWNFVHHFGEKPWDNDPHKQSYYLQNAIRQNKDLTDYYFCYSDYNGQIKFYVEVLRHQGVKVDLNNSLEFLSAGKKVVVSQKPLMDSLQQNFAVQKLEEAFGCTVYLVQRRL